MQQSQCRLQHEGQQVLCDRFLLIGSAQTRFRHLDVPVAEVVPEEDVERATRIVHVVGRQGSVDLLDRSVETG